MSVRLTIGLLLNPFAGIGGSVALKGSDGADTVQQALARGAKPLAIERAKMALELLRPYQQQLDFVCAGADMGANCLEALGFNYQVIFQPNVPSEAVDSHGFVNALNQYAQQHHIDLLLFAGGDGTARDVCGFIDERIPVLGIPAGCKIHSGVYAVTPIAAGRMVEQMAQGELLSLAEANVMDIDETAFRQGIVRAKRYGEMTIPDDLRYVQSVKSGGKESDELVLQDIAAEVIDLTEDGLAIMGSGSTVAAVMAQMDLTNSLLGVDVIAQGELMASDQTANQLLTHVQLAQDEGTPCKLVITVIGGQGHVFGRGNQQLSPALIRTLGVENIIVVATKNKLQSLQGRPLIADTGDAELDQMLSGYIRVVTGYRDYVMYPLASPS
ncbi:ATP-NAD kinase family protein [Neiella marina]|uniref:ATP-NAD kinase family protein n=1 Tax=Neiella holothuriorum TaxID=2870530 RepID=A0ABS7EDK4_9GAMM|nr:ATP-NAD kinase family protein [Neiella holothuriorum]MBW8190413.1 ATP-NAD kinase family protein [Neiella holothuriorum]